MHKRDTYNLDAPTLAEVRAFVEATRDLPGDAEVRSTGLLSRFGLDAAGMPLASLTVDYTPGGAP